MRWSIQSQIVLMFISIAVATVVAMTLVSGYVSYRQSDSEIRSELDKVADSLTDSSFPITDATLRRVNGLTGTELMLIDQNATVAASTIEVSPELLEQIKDFQQPAGVSLQTQVEANGQVYYLTTAKKVSFTTYGAPGKLYVLYPQQTYAREMRKAWLPPVLIGIVGTLLFALLGVLASGRLTRKLTRLRDQVNIIADGQFEPLEVPRRDDEVRQLSISINRMADKLRSYEKQVRAQERQKTFDQIGRAIAHEIRNAVTGGRMAIELHRRTHPTESESSHLEVAVKQLRLMESSVNRFLKMGDTSSPVDTAFDFITVAHRAISLVRPVAEHLDVQFQCKLPDRSIDVRGCESDIEQAMINLMTNAVQAASTCRPGDQDDSLADASVVVETAIEDSKVCFRVRDSGPGPSAEIEGRLFESFCTDKPDGIGLGLSLTRQIILAHRGSIDWRRENGTTEFEFQLDQES